MKPHHSFIEVLASFAPMRMILEIGCDRLEETTPLYRTAFPKATIHCFDPDPRNAAAIRASGAEERLKVHYHELALADSPGHRPFWQSTQGKPDATDWTLSSSLRTPRTFAIEPGQWFHFKSDPIEVLCTTVDRFCAGHGIGSIDLIHIDVQGAEDLVLRGAQAMLPRTRYIYAEHGAGGVYVGEPGLDGIKLLLPDCEIVQCWPNEVLFKNVSI